jgi:hypothetical protein
MVPPQREQLIFQWGLISVAWILLGAPHVGQVLSIEAIVACVIASSRPRQFRRETALGPLTVCPLPAIRR